MLNAIYIYETRLGLQIVEQLHDLLYLSSIQLPALKLWPLLKIHNQWLNNQLFERCIAR